MAHQTKERLFNFEIEIVSCSEKMDLIVIANSRGEVSLHRYLDLQTIWTKKPPILVMGKVQKLSWSPDGGAIAIAYSCSEDFSAGPAGLASRSLILMVSVENEELNSIHLQNCVSCLKWSETTSISNNTGSFTNYFPEPTPLLSNFSIGVNQNRSKKLLRESFRRSINNVLLIGSSSGDLDIYIGGFFACYHLNINDMLKITEQNYSILNCVISDDSKFIFVLFESRTQIENFVDKETQICVLETSALSSNRKEISLLTTSIGRILSLVDNVKEVQSCLTEVWECLKFAQTASNFNKYGDYFDSMESVVADFLELFTFGVLSNSLELFLLQNLNCDCLKKLMLSIKENCSSIENLVFGNLKPNLEELFVTVSELKGMSELTQNGVIGLDHCLVEDVLGNIRVLILKALEIFTIVKNVEKNFSQFYMYLNKIIIQLNSGEMQILDFSGEVTEDYFIIITEYLYSISEMAGDDEPINFFQHLGQYFQEKSLSKPLLPNKWQEFLTKNTDKVTCSCLIPDIRMISLATGFNSLYNSISYLCSASEKVLIPLFSLKDVIDLPQAFTDFSVVEACYFAQSRSLLAIFMNCENTGEVYVVEVSQEQKYTSKKELFKCKHIELKLDSDNCYKCLSVKCLMNDELMILFEERESSNIFLLQMCAASLNNFNTECIYLNVIQDSFFIWQIPFTTVLSFAVSGARKFGVIICKDKKRLKTFEMDPTEGTVEED